MKRTMLVAFLLVVSQPLLIGTGVLVPWLIECGGGACAGTVRANSPFGSPQDALLTALTAAAPYLLVAFVAAVAWLLAGRTAAQPAAEPVPTAPDPRTVARERVGARPRPERQPAAGIAPFLGAAEVRR